MVQYDQNIFAIKDPHAYCIVDFSCTIFFFTNNTCISAFTTGKSLIYFLSKNSRVNPYYNTFLINIRVVLQVDVQCEYGYVYAYDRFTNNLAKFASLPSGVVLFSSWMLLCLGTGIAIFKAICLVVKIMMFLFFQMDQHLAIKHALNDWMFVLVFCFI